MKHLRSLSLAVAGIVALSPTHAATFDDVQFWAGSGANRAALVVDWNDGKSPESLLWGYRWDGAATGLDMLQAVAVADSRLFAHFGNYVWGTATLGLGYDLNQSGGFAVSPSLSFDSGGLAVDTNPDDARVAADPADHWLEGWNNGFWAYYLKATTADPWDSAVFGAADRLLADGMWDGYRFAPGFAGSEPSEPVPAVVPEPASCTLLFIGSLALACVWRQRSNP